MNENIKDGERMNDCSDSGGYKREEEKTQGTTGYNDDDDDECESDDDRQRKKSHTQRVLVTRYPPKEIILEGIKKSKELYDGEKEIGEKTDIDKEKKEYEKEEEKERKKIKELRSQITPSTILNAPKDISSSSSSPSPSSSSSSETRESSPDHSPPFISSFHSSQSPSLPHLLSSYTSSSSSDSSDSSIPLPIHRAILSEMEDEHFLNIQHLLKILRQSSDDNEHLSMLLECSETSAKRIDNEMCKKQKEYETL
jgi:hypothetical protein